MKTCRVLATELCERDSRSSSVSTCFTAGSEISRHSEQTWSDADSVCSSASSVSSGSLTKQQMRKATRALGDVLGDRYAGLIDSLSSSLDSADDSTMKMFAERMVSAAVLQAPLPSASSK
nr:hypothetical protein B0A51_16730 [Rachicladosporium sp. CCFEE 5018]